MHSHSGTFTKSAWQQASSPSITSTPPDLRGGTSLDLSNSKPIKWPTSLAKSASAALDKGPLPFEERETPFSFERESFAYQRGMREVSLEALGAAALAPGED